MTAGPRGLPARVVRWWAGISVRTRVLLIAIGLLGTGLVIAGVVANAALHGYLIGRTDSRLDDAAKLLSRPTTTPRAQLEDVQRQGSPSRDGLPATQFVEFLDGSGALVQDFRSAGVSDGAQPGLPLLDRDAVAAHGGDAFDVPSRDGSISWRVLALPADPSRSSTVDGRAQLPPADGSVVVAAPLTEVDATIDRLRTISTIATVSLIAVLVVVGWLAMRAGLRPLRRIEETAAAIAGGDVGKRVPELAGPRTEVGHLAAALNGMLSRNEAAFEARAASEARMRRFVADASHELRTPLVGIKGLSTLYLMGALAEPAEVARAMDRIEKESERLRRLVEDLLLLARLDEHQRADEHTPAGGFSLDMAPTDLRTLAVDALHDLRALDPTRRARLSGPDGGPPGSAPALADEARLRQVVTNLVGNAVTHTAAGTPIRIGVGTADRRAILEVADQGPGLTAEQAARVFDRFYRADRARSRTTGGAGLGLSIVHSLVVAQGGQVHARSTPGEGAVFRVSFPVHTGPPE